MRIEPIRIPIPTTTEVTIKQAQLMPFCDFRPLRSSFDPSEQVKEKWVQRGAKGDFNLLLKFNAKTGKVKEITFPCTNWRNMVYTKQKVRHLQDPANRVGLFFIGGKNFRKIADHPIKTEMFVIDDVFYRRLTWRSLGVKSNEAGIFWKTAENITFFLYPCHKLNKQEYKEAFMDAIGIEVIKSDKPVPEEVAEETT